MSSLGRIGIATQRTHNAYETVALRLQVHYRSMTSRPGNRDRLPNSCPTQRSATRLAKMPQR